MWAAMHVEFACCAGCLYAGPLRARAGENEARPRENEARPLASVAARRRCCLCAVQGAPRASRPGSLLCALLLPRTHECGSTLRPVVGRVASRTTSSAHGPQTMRQTAEHFSNTYRSHDVHALFHIHRHGIMPHNHIKIIDCDFTTMIIMCRPLLFHGSVNSWPRAMNSRRCAICDARQLTSLTKLLCGCKL